MGELEGLDNEQLAAYFALMEVGGLLRHAVEGQLRAGGGLSYVQFGILARLADAPSGRRRMTDLADGVVYSRSGLTYQAGRLEEAGLISREPAADDERGTTVEITAAGRELLARVMPGHVRVARQMLLDPLEPVDVAALTDILGRVRDRMRAAPPRSAAPRSRRTQRTLRVRSPSSRRARGRRGSDRPGACRRAREPLDGRPSFGREVHLS